METCKAAAVRAEQMKRSQWALQNVNHAAVEHNQPREQQSIKQTGEVRTSQRTDDMILCRVDAALLVGLTGRTGGLYEQHTTEHKHASRTPRGVERVPANHSTAVLTS